MTASNAAIVQRLISDGLNQHSLSVMRDLMRDTTYHLPLVGELRGDDLMQFFDSLLSGFPDVQRKVDEQLTERRHSLDNDWNA